VNLLVVQLELHTSCPCLDQAQPDETLPAGVIVGHRPVATDGQVLGTDCWVEKMVEQHLPVLLV
jgi:hypothetical protein